MSQIGNAVAQCLQFIVTAPNNDVRLQAEQQLQQLSTQQGKICHH